MPGKFRRCTTNNKFYMLLILGIKIVQEMLEVEEMVVGIELDSMNNNNSSWTDMNSIYFSLFLS